MCNCPFHNLDPEDFAQITDLECVSSPFAEINEEIEAIKFELLSHIKSTGPLFDELADLNKRMDRLEKDRRR